MNSLRNKVLNAGFSLFLLTMACTLLRSQDITGSIAGTVTDPAGAPVANASVIIYSVDRNTNERTVVTDTSGNFSAPLLHIGRYNLTVEAKGFKKFVRSNIVLNVADKLTYDVGLQIGDLSQQVTVSDTAVQVQLQSPEQSTLINGTQIRELSLNTRNYEQLVTLMPGVSAGESDQIYVGTTNPSGQTNTLNFSINGARNSSNSWMVDGADNVDRGSNQTALTTPSVDALAEFKVQRSNYSAEFGRAGGGQINVVTKSGTSRFSGSLYEFVRSDAFAANNFLNNANRVNLGPDGKAKVAPLHWNDFGWTLGGPIFIPRVYNTERNKTFFFVSEEFRRIITYTSTTSTVPTDAEKTGLFPHPVCAVYSGSTCTQAATQITNINPVAQQYIQQIFSRIPSGSPGTNGLASILRNVFNFEQEIYKLDHVVNPKLHLSVRYLRDSIPTTEPQGLFTGDPIPNLATTSTNSPGRSWTGRATSTLSPTWLNEAGFNYSYGAIISNPTGLMSSQVSPGIKPVLPFPSTLARVPTLTFTGGTSLTSFGPYRDYNRNYNGYDNMTNVLGSHTLKYGFTYNHYQKTENAGGGNQGTFAFTSARTSLPPGGASLFEQAFANFLTGNVASFTQTSLDLTPDIRSQQWEVYLQDDWRMKPNFTLNLGLRYSAFRTPIDNKGELTTFDPSRFVAAQAPQLDANGFLVPNTGNPLNGIVIAGQNSPYGDKVANESTLDFAPRVGFAWDPFKTSQTAIRGGYGIFYDATLYGIYEQNIFNNPPFVNSINIPNTRLDDPAAGTPSINSSPKALRATSPINQAPYTQQWNLDIQRRIGAKTLFDVAYVGTKGTHLIGIVDENTVYPGLAYTSGLVSPSTTITSQNYLVLNRLRPFPGYNAINTIVPWFNSNYNALQLYVQRQFQGNSQVSVSYTFSKNLTDAQTDRSSAPQNFYNRHEGEYGPAQFDRRHILTANFVYELPFFRAQQGVTGKVLGGWEVSGIAYFNSGLPYTVTTSAGTDPAALGILGPSAASPRPDMVCNPNSGAPRDRFQWFDKSCFVDVPTGVHRPGNAGRGVVRGPGFQRWDLAAFKNLRFGENMQFQLRGEAVNAFNHANPSGIGTSLGAGTFATVVSYRDARVIQLAAKFYF